MLQLELQAVNLSIAGKQLCRDLNLVIAAGQYWGMLGKNGVGKTSLLYSIMQLRPVDCGDILLDGRHVRQLSRRELATHFGILFQENANSMPATVLETVMLGRHPHFQSLLKDDPADLEIARAALRQLGLEELAQRQVNSLSGGESQRLSLAMLLAQEPAIYLLDEPSNHLDIAFQIKTLELLKRKVHSHHASLLMATHEINLAARFCDWILLLMGDGDYIAGAREDVLTAKNLSQAYGCNIEVFKSGDRNLYFPA